MTTSTASSGSCVTSAETTRDRGGPLSGSSSDILSLALLLQETRARDGERLAIVDEKTSWSFDELCSRGAEVAAALRRDGVEEGDRVVLDLGNSPAFLTAYVGVVMASAVPVPIDPTASDETLSLILNDCEPRVVICESDFSARVSAASEGLLSLRSLYVRGASASFETTLRIRDLDHLEGETGANGPPPPFDPEDPALIIYTSGTTDVPKGVVLTHRNLHSLIRTGVETFELSGADRIGHVLPLFHLYGIREVQAAFALGATLVMSRKSSFPASLLQWFQAQRVTAFPGVPGLFSLFLSRYESLLRALDPRLRYVLVGTSPTQETLLERLRSVLPTTKIFKTYGLTECGRVTTGDFTSAETPFDSVGVPSRGVVISAHDASGKELLPGEPGQISIQSEMVMRGYWRRPEDTAEVLSGRRFKTRDLGYLDASGRLFLIGRVDQMINIGGEKIAPWEVEMVLKRHPAVQDAAVLGAPDEASILGEVAQAFVVQAPGAGVTIEELRRHCAEHLESYKVPRKIVFIDEMPKTSLGKNALRQLKELRSDTRSEPT